MISETGNELLEFQTYTGTCGFVEFSNREVAASFPYYLQSCPEVLIQREMGESLSQNIYDLKQLDLIQY